MTQTGRGRVLDAVERQSVAFMVVHAAHVVLWVGLIAVIVFAHLTAAEAAVAFGVETFLVNRASTAALRTVDVIIEETR